MNVKISVSNICVEVIIYLLLYNLYGCILNIIVNIYRMPASKIAFCFHDRICAMPHTNLLKSVFISKCAFSLCILVFALEKTYYHYLSSSVTSRLWFTLKIYFWFSQWRKPFPLNGLVACTFLMRNTGKLKLTEPIIEVSFLIFSYGLFMNFLILIIMCSVLSLFGEWVMFVESITNSNKGSCKAAILCDKSKLTSVN